MMMSNMNLKSYSDTSYHNEELNSLTRYLFDKVKERAKLKSSVSRLVCILFPELEKLVPTLHMASVYALLSEFPGASAVASAHLTKLSNLLSVSSKGRYGKDTAVMFREYALYNATKYVCHWDESFVVYLEKKRCEDKHYNFALSHATKKLVRLIFAMEKSGRAYTPAA